MPVTKKQQEIRKQIQPRTVKPLYELSEAIKLLQQFASKKFNESIEICINLGVDPRKSDQVVRSSTKLPEGTGKKVRVAVFAQGDNADKATAAGADIVGFED